MPYAPDSYPRQIPQFKVHGRGEVTVSAKGIVTGDSNIPNGGADFGPDTMLGATGPGQYGLPYTQTVGIAEAFNYITESGGEVIFSPDIFYIHDGITFLFDSAVKISGTSWGVGGGASNNIITNMGTVIAPASDFPASTYLITFGNITTNYGSLELEDMIFFGSLSMTSPTPYAIGITTGGGASGVAGQTFKNLSFLDCQTGLDAGESGGPMNGTNIFHYNCTPYGMHVSSIDAKFNNLLFYQSSLTCNNGQFTNIFMDANSSQTDFNLSGDVNMTNVHVRLTSGVNIINLTGPYCNVNIDNISINSYTGSSSSDRLIGIANITTQGSLIITNLQWNLTSNFAGYIMGEISGATSALLNTVFSNWSILMNGYTIANGFLPLSGQSLLLRNITGYSLTPTIPSNPPVTATVYQNTNPYDIEIDLPVYATTSGTAGYVTLAKGPTSTPTSIGNQYVNGATSSTSVDIIRLRVPAGWYYSFTASGVTFGTASVFAD